MDILLKAAAVAAAGAVLSLVIKKSNPEMAVLFSISVALVVLYLAAGAIESVTDFFQTVGDAAGISSAVLNIVLKTVGISVITKLSADMCRDAGQASLASGLELVGAVTAMYIALPLFKSVISMVDSLV